MRRFIIALSLTVMVTTACSGGTTTLTPRETDSESPSVSTETVDELPLTDSPEDEDSSTAESSPAALELGDRANPAPVGTLVQISDDSGQAKWNVTLVGTNLNVNEEIITENQFNGLPDAGFQYAAATFLVKYVGSDKGFPGSDLSVAFVSSSSTTHKESDAFIVGPDSLDSLNELYTGGEEEGSVYISIPTMAAADGTWRLSHTFDNGEYFFQAQ